MDELGKVQQKADAVDQELSRTVPLIGTMQGAIDTLGQAAGAVEARVDHLEKNTPTLEEINAQIEKEVRRLVDLYFKQLELPADQTEAMNALKVRRRLPSDSDSDSTSSRVSRATSLARAPTRSSGFGVARALRSASPTRPARLPRGSGGGARLSRRAVVSLCVCVCVKGCVCVCV